MRTFFLLLLTIIYAPAMASGAEYVTAPAEASAPVEGGNYSIARANAIDAAFLTASRLVAAGLVSEERRPEVTAIIDERLAENPSLFVASYKFLGETTTAEGESLIVRIQVTLFLDTLRRALAEGGATVRRRLLPTLLVIIDERSMDFFTSTNFLLLNSRAEEALSLRYRDRGYTIINRQQIREMGLDEAVMAAIEGDNDTLGGLMSRLKADMALFGTAEVEVSPIASGGGEVTARVKARLLAPDGSQLAEEKADDRGIYDDPLKGGIETLILASERVAREITVQTPRVWKEYNRRRGE